MKSKVKPNVVRGGNAIDLGNNLFLMHGKTHEEGGIDIGNNPRTGLEVEDKEVMQITPKNVKVFSAQPILNGVSPAQYVLGGANPNDVFNAQEYWKKTNGVKDDGSKARFGKKKDNNKQKEINWDGIVTTNNRPYNSANIDYIYKGLVTRGFTNKRAASITGNIIEESGGDPFAIDKTGKFKGLLQWSNDRYNPSDNTEDIFGEIDRQLDYISSTATNITDKKSWHHGGKGSGYNTAKDANDAFYNDENDLSSTMRAYTLGYVRPAGGIKSYENRLKVAQQVYDRVNGVESHSTGDVKKFGGMTKQYYITKNNIYKMGGRKKAAFGDEVELVPIGNGIYGYRIGNTVYPTRDSASEALGIREEDLDSYMDSGRINSSVVSAERPQTPANNSVGRTRKVNNIAYDNTGWQNYVEQDYNPTKRAWLGPYTYNNGAQALYYGQESFQNPTPPFKSNWDENTYEPSTKNYSDYVPAPTSRQRIGYSISPEPLGPQPNYSNRAPGSSRDLGNSLSGSIYPSDRGNLYNSNGNSGVQRVQSPFTGGVPSTQSLQSETPIKENKVALSSNPQSGNRPSGNRPSSRRTSRPTQTPQVPTRETLNLQGPNLGNIQTPGVIGPNNNQGLIGRTVQSWSQPSSSSTPSNPKTPNTSPIGNFFKGNSANLIGLGINLAGNLASSLINRNAINSLEGPVQPAQYRAEKLKTDININPQLGEIQEMVGQQQNDIVNNTASSRTALARRNRVRNIGLQQTNQLYGYKENAETQLINQDRQNRQQVSNRNVDLYNDWRRRNVEFENNRRNAIAENAVAGINNATSAIGGFIGNVNKQRENSANLNKDLLSLELMARTSPNATPVVQQQIDNTIRRYKTLYPGYAINKLGGIKKRNKK